MKKTTMLTLAACSFGAGVLLAPFYDDIKAWCNNLEFPKFAKTEQNFGKPQLSATTDIELNQSQSIVYCPTMTIAWQELRQQFELPKPTEFTKQLDHDAQQFTRCALPEESFVIFSGKASPDLLQQLQTAHQQLFNEKFDVDHLSSEHIIQYAALKHAIDFEKPFEVLSPDLHPTTFTTQTGHTYEQSFDFFGCFKDLPKYNNQVDVIRDQADDFTLRLHGKKETSESVILSMFSQPPSTLIAAIEQTNQRLKQWDDRQAAHTKRGFPPESWSPKNPAPLRLIDSILIPNISLNLKTSITELIGLPLSKVPDRTPYAIDESKQMIAFDLTHAGAKVKSYANNECAVESFEKPAPTTPREFHFNKPFLCTLWKDGESMPYLAVWVNGPDVLEKSSN